jgi:hypothetical protein
MPLALATSFSGHFPFFEKGRSPVDEIVAMNHSTSMPKQNLLKLVKD